MLDTSNDGVRDLHVAAGRSLRFAVESRAGRRSNVWSLFASKYTPDYYLVGRASRGSTKVSFHASGRWSNSYIADGAMPPGLPAGASRHRELWQAPPEFAPGIRRAYTIIAPAPDLRPVSDTARKRVILVTPEDDETWVTFSIWQVSPDLNGELTWHEDVRLVGTIPLSDGGTVVVLAEPVDPKEGLGRRVRESREKVLRQVPSWLLHHSDAEHFRVQTTGEFEGTRYWLDLAVDPPPAGAPVCSHALSVWPRDDPSRD